MNTPNLLPPRTTAFRAVVVATSFLLGIAVNTLQAADKDTDAKGPAPVSVSFDKASGDNGPYVMTVTNTASDEIKVKLSVFESVQAHNKAKTRELPEKKLGAGEKMTVDALAATDKVTIHAKGFAPLEIVVPTGTN